MSAKRLVWKLSDGTEVELGGGVRGESAFAHDLRLDVEAGRRGQPRHVYRVAPGLEPLALEDAELVNSWVRNRAHLFSVEVVEAPEVGTSAPDEDAPEGVEY